MDWRGGAAGIAAGFTEVTGTHWLDVLKTRAQELQQYQRNRVSIYQVAKTIKQESITGFYKGYLARVTNVSFMRLIFWNSQKQANQFFVQKDFSRPIALILGGGTCGLVQTIVDTPLEVIKTKQIATTVTQDAKYFAGFVPNALRNIVFASWVSLIANYYDMNTPLERFSVGALGGAMGAITSHPLDVVKTELQRPVSNSERRYGTSTLEILRNIYKNNPKNLMCGCIPRTVQSILTMGIGFTAYMFVYDTLIQKY